MHRASSQGVSRGPRALALALLILIAFLCSGPARAADDTRVQLVPALSGYPIGADTPLILFATVPPHFKFNPDVKPGVEITFKDDKEFMARVASLRLMKGGQAVVVVAEMQPLEGAATGPRQVEGTLTITMPDQEPAVMPMVLPIEILAKGRSTLVISQEMLDRLGVKAPANAKLAPPPPMDLPPQTSDRPGPGKGAGMGPGQGRGMGAGMGMGAGQGAGQGRAAGTGQTQARQPVEVPAKAPAATTQDAATEDDPFAGESAWWIFLLVFAAGLGLNFTPCVYPLIPITVSFFGGQAQGSKRVLATNAFAYWAGLTLMYSILGAVVALSGQMLGAALTHPVVVLIIAGVLVALGLSMFGIWELRMPASLNRLAASNRSGLVGTFFMGLTVGILAAPCVGPFVVGLMTHVALKGEVVYGFLVFFTLAAGLGLPLSLLAFFSGSLQRLPGAGEWMVWVRKLFGVILFGMALYIALPLIGFKALTIALTVLGVIGGAYLGFVEKSGKGRFLTIKKVVGVLMILLAVGHLGFWYQTSTKVAKVHWQPFTAQAYQEAVASGEPTVVYFTADWCPPCRKLKAQTWPAPPVQEAVRGFRTIMADVTNGPPPEAKPYFQAWGIRGVPTILFLDAKGEPMADLTVVGFVGPGQMARRLNEAKARRSGG